MADLGAPVTTKYKIGTVECRIGPMSLANKLTQANSIGLIQNAQIQVQQQETDLMGGFPQRILDSAISSETTQITATLEEFSRRNLQLLLGQGVNATPPTDVSSTVATAAVSGATSLTLATGAGANFSVGDLVVVYGAGAPENVQVVRVASITTDTLTLDGGTPLLADVAIGDPVYKAAEVPIGGLSSTNYVAVQIVSLERGSGRPTGFNFWKGSVSGGMDMTLGGTSFASTSMTIKLLEPAAVEYATGNPLVDLANIIPSHPIGMYFGGADS